MEIIFKEIRRDQYTVTYTGIVDGEEAGYVDLLHHSRPMLELTRLWLTKRGQEVTRKKEFLDAFCAYLKEQGHTELRLESEEDELESWWGFRLEERDNSGWYPKYSFRRKL